MKAKKFDSVKMMREIREKLSKDFSKLSVKEKMALSHFKWVISPPLMGGVRGG
jgi:hypothetical protein